MKQAARTRLNGRCFAALSMTRRELATSARTSETQGVSTQGPAAGAPLNMTSRGSRRGAKGSQLIELALVMPLFLVLGLIVAEGAGAVRTHQVLNNAAREAARLAIQKHNWTACDVSQGCTCDSACVQLGLQNAVVTYAANNGISDVKTSQITVDQDCQIPVGTTTNLGCPKTCGSASGCIITSQIVVSYPYQLTYLPRLPWISQSATVSLVARSEFRNLP